MKTNSIIKPIRGKPFSDVDLHIIRIKGGKAVPKPTFYRNLKTGDEYSCLIGALAWPRPTRPFIPGYALVMAVLKSKDPQPEFVALEEAVEGNIHRLMMKCVDMREKWGYWECPELFRPWYGEYERYAPVISDFNFKLQKKRGAHEDFYPSMPPLHKDRDRIKVYLNRIMPLLQDSPETGLSRLIMKPCTTLQRHIAQLSREASNLKIEDSPPLTALGHCVYTLLDTKPWLVYVYGFDEVDYENEDDRELGEALEDHYAGEREDADDAELIETVM